MATWMYVQTSAGSFLYKIHGTEADVVAYFLSPVLLSLSWRSHIRTRHSQLVRCDVVSEHQSAAWRYVSAQHHYHQPACGHVAGTKHILTQNSPSKGTL